MPGQIIRRLKPEEEEILRKREELVSIQAELAELELELADLRNQLAIFEGQYLRQVGSLYAELDEWNARISELRARLNPSKATKQQAEDAREQARQTHNAAHDAASRTREFHPSPELRNLFREVAKRIHPDLAADLGDRERRNRLMAEANRAYQAGDFDALRRILDGYQDGKTTAGEEIGAELIRIIRQISQARDRVSGIYQELITLRESKIAKLKKESDAAQKLGRDMLSELATAIRKKILNAKEEYGELAREVNLRDR